MLFFSSLQFRTWLQEVVLRILRSHNEPGPSVHSLSDLLEIHKQLHEELSQRRAEFFRLKETTMSRLSPTHDRPDAESKFNEIDTLWRRCEELVLQRSDLFNALLRLIRRLPSENATVEVLLQRLSDLERAGVNAMEDKNLEAQVEEARLRVEGQQKELRELVTKVSHRI